MTWEEAMFAVFDDLEQQAQGLHLLERDAEVADLTAAEYAGVDLASRLHASFDLDLQVRLLGGRVVSGRLVRTGDDWFLLADPRAEWVVRYAAVASIDGLSPRADNQDTWSVADRLSLRSVLRRLSAAGESCAVHFTDERQVEGRIGRVGGDFFELHRGEGAGQGAQVVPTGAVAALQERP